MKAYVHTRSFENSQWIAYFTAKKAEAWSWSSEQDAAIEAAMLENLGIHIKTAHGKDHVCTDYKVEERAPGEFILSLVGPFALAA